MAKLHLNDLCAAYDESCTTYRMLVRLYIYSIKSFRKYRNIHEIDL
jgi:hypothetical protein